MFFTKMKHTVPAIAMLSNTMNDVIDCSAVPNPMLVWMIRISINAKMFPPALRIPVT